VISCWNVASCTTAAEATERLAQGLEILQRLDDQGRLTASEQARIPPIQAKLDELNSS
jgi:hypothetical protein